MFPLLSTLSMIIKISGKSVHLAPKWLQKVSSTKTLPTSKVESLVKPNFDLNQTCKIILTQNHEIWNFNATELIDILIKDRRKLLHLWKMSKN